MMYVFYFTFLPVRYPVIRKYHGFYYLNIYDENLVKYDEPKQKNSTTDGRHLMTADC